jgi:putative transposase
MEPDQERVLSRVARHQCAVGEQDCQRDKGIWQRRYWEHVIRNDTDLERHINYIHYNPVKHGLVARVSDWPYSSFHRYVARGDFPIDWAGNVREIAGEFGER